MQPVEKPVEILQYKTNVGYFVKVKGAYTHSIFAGLIVNGLTHESAIVVSGYAKLENEVTSVQQKINAVKRIVHYTLKDKDLESSKLPLIAQVYYNDHDEELKLRGVEGYEALYEPVYEETKESFVDVPFVIVDMGEFIIEDPTNIKKRKIKIRSDTGAVVDRVIEYDLSTAVIYDDIIKLITPEFAITQAPCRLTSHQMYRITRQYILENLDMKENVITSNYDFCFAVKKRVHTKPFVKIVSSLTGRNKWKQKSVTTTEKQVDVFEMTYSGYKGAGGYEGYTCIPELTGENLEDLANKLESFLDNIITALNTRVEECECCKGTGHIVVKSSVT